MTATLSPTDEAEARVVLDPDAPRAVWLAARRKGIGGSDASTVADLNPYSSRYALWLDKTGREVDDRDNDAMEWGRRLEPVVADWFAEHKGLTLYRAGLMASVERPWQVCSVDRLANDGGGVEIKTLSWRVAHEWDDGQIPDHAELQSQHCMAVTGRPHWWVVGLVDGRNPLVRRVTRDEQLIHDLTEMERRFWFDNVLADVEPAVDPKALPAVKYRYRKVTPDKAVPVSGEDLAPLLARYEAAAAREKQAKADRAEVDAELRLLFKDAEAIRVGDTIRATCKEQTQRRIDAARLRADHPDLARQYEKTTTFRKLHII